MSPKNRRAALIAADRRKLAQGTEALPAWKPKDQAGIERRRAAEYGRWQAENAGDPVKVTTLTGDVARWSRVPASGNTIVMDRGSQLIMPGNGITASTVTRWQGRK